MENDFFAAIPSNVVYFFVERHLRTDRSHKHKVNFGVMAFTLLKMTDDALTFPEKIFRSLLEIHVFSYKKLGSDHSIKCFLI